VKMPVDDDQLGPRMKKELLKKRTQMLPIFMGDEALKRERKRKREEEEKAQREEIERAQRIKQEKEALAQLTQSALAKSAAREKASEKFSSRDKHKTSSGTKYSVTTDNGTSSRSRSPKRSPHRDEGYKRPDRGERDRERGREDRSRYTNYPPPRSSSMTSHKERDMRPDRILPSWSRPPPSSQQVIHVPVYVPVPQFRPPPPPVRVPPPPPPRGASAPYSSGPRDPPSSDYHHPNFEVSWGGVDPRRPSAAAAPPRGAGYGQTSTWDSQQPAQWSAPSSSAIENAFQAVEDSGPDVAMDLLNMLSSLERQPTA